MAYTINLTDGTVFATVNDGTVNTSSSVTLVGKNYAGYGEYLDENFIQMLENFSNTTAPVAPLTGQIWWDKTNTLLKVYNGTLFKTLSFSAASATQPSGSVTGDLWYDTTNQQLKVYTGSSFIVVGPAYTSATGTAGAIPETITDSGATPHYVTSLYVANVRVAIFSTDSTFTAAAPVSTLFPTVYKGVTFTNASGTNMAGNIISASNVVITAGGATTATITSTGANITGYTTSSGNVTGGNINTAGLISATGNVIGANFVGNVVSPAGSNVSTTGNVTAGNILTSGIMSSTGNGIHGNILTGGLISATGNITSAANVSGGNIVTGGLISATSNIAGGNVLTGGLISAAGNVTAGTGSFYFGNGSQLTGVVAVSGSVTKILNGTSWANIAAADGNIVMAVGGTTVITVDAATLYTNNLSATGTIRVNSGAAATAIVNGAGNVVGNIGSSTGYFNRIFAQATTALYADVAERFAADEVLDAGTVVELGGSAEITKSLVELSDNVFGVISTRAAYLMNGGAGEDDTHPPVAMTGRVPVKVIGVIHKGDRLVSAGNGIARAAKPNEASAFNVIGRSLVDKLTPESATIEAIVTIKN